MTSRIFSCLDSCRSELRSRSLASTGASGWCSGCRARDAGQGCRGTAADGGDRPAGQIYRRHDSPHARSPVTGERWGRLAAMRRPTACALLAAVTPFALAACSDPAATMPVATPSTRGSAATTGLDQHDGPRPTPPLEPPASVTPPRVHARRCGGGIPRRLRRAGADPHRGAGDRRRRTPAPADRGLTRPSGPDAYAAPVAGTGRGRRRRRRDHLSRPRGRGQGRRAGPRRRRVVPGSASRPRGSRRRSPTSAATSRRVCRSAGST